MIPKTKAVTYMVIPIGIVIAMGLVIYIGHQMLLPRQGTTVVE